jgi:glycosyltransferase involved in cell wall biosynthesis
MENEKRILVIPSWYPPDGGYFFKEHSEAIQKMGWQVDLLVNRLVGIRKLMQAGISALRPYRVVKEGELRVIRSFYLKLPGSEKYNIRGWAYGTTRMYKRYRKQFGSPDLLLAHSVTWAGYAAYLINREFGIPYIIVEHRSFFVWSTEQARQMVKPFYLPVMERAISHCRKLVLVSESMRRGLEVLAPSSKKNTLVIPNMIREDMFMLPLETRKRDPFLFVWAGRLEHVKGVDLLLEAVRLLMERTEREFQVHLAGKGSLRGVLEQQATELKISDLVKFMGRLSRFEMQKELQGANCFILPSRYEAFGVVLIEAMATGLPVIATRSGGPEAIVTPGNGLLVEPENAEQLSQAMEHIMNHLDDYPQGRIREQTLQTFGNNSVMEQYNRLFIELTEE